MSQILRNFGRKVPGTCGQPENQRNRVPLVTRVRHRDYVRLRKLLQPEGLDSWPKTTGGKGVHLMGPDRPRHQSRRRAPVLQPDGATPGSDSSRSLHDLVRAGKTQQAYLYRLSAQRTRHDGDRRLFPARWGGIPRRRAGDVGAGRAWDSPGCIHDRAAAPSGAAAPTSVRLNEHLEQPRAPSGPDTPARWRWRIVSNAWGRAVQVRPLARLAQQEPEAPAVRRDASRDAA